VLKAKKQTLSQEEVRSRNLESYDIDATKSSNDNAVDNARQWTNCDLGSFYYWTTVSIIRQLVELNL